MRGSASRINRWVKCDLGNAGREFAKHLQEGLLLGVVAVGVSHETQVVDLWQWIVGQHFDHVVRKRKALVAKTLDSAPA